MVKIAIIIEVKKFQQFLRMANFFPRHEISRGSIAMLTELQDNKKAATASRLTPFLSSSPPKM
jgi:hypothetical protein